MASSQVSRAARRAGKGLLPRPRPKQPHEYAVLLKDPAIERWNTMRETTTPHFKWTPKTVAMAIFWLGVVPGSLYKIVKDDVTKQYIAEGKEPAFFPNFNSSRKPDPLPPRKPGIRVEL